MKDILRKIIYGAEITIVNDTDAYLNKYRNASQKIDISYANILLFLKIIGFDSGNFETGERHYRLEEPFYSVKDKIKTIHLGKIGECIESHKPAYYVTYPVFKELEKAYNDLRNQLLRKEKLKKIETYGSNELL